jgi:predicted methyltransferase
MYPKFGFFTPEQLEAKKTWVTDWTAEANTWRADDDATIEAFTFGHMPAEMEGTADAVLFIRALHNLARFETDGGFLTMAINDAFRVLKPGGFVGIVQHQARENMSDEWASGRNGYLKKSFIIGIMDEAGFDLIGSSDINKNDLDQPSETDIVWRLPPSLATSKDDPVLKSQLEAIGESNRMTLLFRKPK